MVCTSQFLTLLSKNKINLSQIAQIILISLEFSPVGYCIHASALLGQPHIVSTGENSLRPLELIYIHKNVDFDFFFPPLCYFPFTVIFKGFVLWGSRASCAWLCKCRYSELQRPVQLLSWLAWCGFGLLSSWKQSFICFVDWALDLP